MLQKGIDNKFHPRKSKPMIKQQSPLFAMKYNFAVKKFNFELGNFVFCSVKANIVVARVVILKQLMLPCVLKNYSSVIKKDF